MLRGYADNADFKFANESAPGVGDTELIGVTAIWQFDDSQPLYRQALERYVLPCWGEAHVLGCFLSLAAAVAWAGCLAEEGGVPFDW